MVKISLFASAVRPKLWPEFFESLVYNSIKFEVVFAGPLTEKEIRKHCPVWYRWFRYIHTGNIKPAQCYEVARRECVGELVNWTADDVCYDAGLLDDVYAYWKSLNNYKTIVSVKTNENNTFNDLNSHRFYGWNLNTPLMAPLGFMNRKWLDEIGGLDRRYICGQYENDIVMRSNQHGGKVYKFEKKEVKIEHLKKHGKKTKFWTEYDHDREILENSWVIGGYRPYPGLAFDVYEKRAFYPIVADREVSLTQLDRFEPYDSEFLLTKSQSFKGEWE